MKRRIREIMCPYCNNKNGHYFEGLDLRCGDCHSKIPRQMVPRVLTPDSWWSRALL
jgi:DNA-directed RNA polymerase subunit RPC12/RpoP